MFVPCCKIKIESRIKYTATCKMLNMLFKVQNLEIQGSHKGRKSYKMYAWAMTIAFVTLHKLYIYIYFLLGQHEKPVAP